MFCRRPLLYQAAAGPSVSLLGEARLKQDGAAVYNPAGKELDVLGYDANGSYAGGTLGCLSLIHI